MSLSANTLADAPYAVPIHMAELDDFGPSSRGSRPPCPPAPSTPLVWRRSTTATSGAGSCGPTRAPGATDAAPAPIEAARAAERTGRLELSQTMVPMTPAPRLDIQVRWEARLW
jgi:hypothetical protein